jgi:hypothetical protein
MPSDVDDYDDDYSGGGDEVEIRRLVLSIDFGTTYTGQQHVISFDVCKY